MVFSLLWFYLATFVIVPVHAVEVYGTAESYYFQRYGALGSSPLDIFKSFFVRPGVVWAVATEPARVAYILELLRPYGFLALLAPDVLLLALPVLLANQLSAYPAQYYGEFHYSAPVAPYFAAGAAYGVARLWRWLARRTARTSGSFQHMPAAGSGIMALAAMLHNSRTALRPLIAVGLVLWVLTWGVASYVDAGRGPGGGRYDPAPVNAHHRLLTHFTAQVPRDTAVTATAAVHPHLSLRRFIYQFPIGLDAPVPAEWALLDVTTATDMAPGDLRELVHVMLGGEWGVVDGADGFLLLRVGAANKEIPDAFYNFARATAAEVAMLPRVQGGSFLGAAIDDRPRWRQTKVITYWRAEDEETGGSEAQIDVRNPVGETIYRFADAMPPALVWYPPARWQPGEIIKVTTLPLYLPRSWGLLVEGQQIQGVVAEPGAALAAAYSRGADGQLLALPQQLAATPELGDALDMAGMAAYRGQGGALQSTEGGPVVLQSWLSRQALAPGETLDLWLNWQPPQGWPADQVVFVHLRQAGDTVAQHDGLPRYFARDDGLGRPELWITEQVVAGRMPVLPDEPWITDWRQITAPPESNNPAAPWQVVVGLYNPATGERAQVMSENGQQHGDDLVVAELPVAQPPVPDQSCALIPLTCASQPLE